MSKSNEIKSEQLGMSYGKAGNILRKKIMFSLVEKCGMNKCHQCGEIIDNIDNFSIEHITPWLHSKNPVDLYFDIDNIAFSHTKCNIANARRGKLPSKFNIGATGFRGVIFNRDGKKDKFKYIARIKIDGKNKFIGYFNDPIEGAKAYDAKAIEIYGEDVETNKSMGLY